MIFMLQFTPPQSLGNKKVSRVDARISLRSGNIRYFLGGLGDGEDGKMRDQVRGWMEGDK